MSERDQSGNAGCCQGLQRRTPARLFNRPGLDHIEYRSGIYSLFRQSMHAALSSLWQPDFKGLQTRSVDDFTIALIDAWAVAGDVLTFYIERTSQEQYLATATERRSVDDLVHLIGYHLRPGVAATTSLAFSLEAVPGDRGGSRPVPIPGVPDVAPIPRGLRVQSIPSPGEVPQTFETVEEIEARAGWNVLGPRQTRPHVLANGDEDAWLQGVGLNLGVGDTLLFVAHDWLATSPDDRWDLHRVTRVEADPATRRTRVQWDGPLAKLAPRAAVGVTIYAMRQSASLFGYNAPDPQLLAPDVAKELRLTREGDWAFNEIYPGPRATIFHFSSVVPGVKPEGWLVLTRSVLVPVRDLVPIIEVREHARSGYGVSAQVTSIVTDRRDARFNGRYDRRNVRATRALLGSEQLPLADHPISEPVYGDEIRLDRALDPINAPRRIIVRGRRPVATLANNATITLTTDGGGAFVVSGGMLTVRGIRVEKDGRQRMRLQSEEGIEGAATVGVDLLVYQVARDDAPFISEEATCVEVSSEVGVAVLHLQEPLGVAFDRASTEILGNIIRATHGETVRREVLGSGDGSKRYQRFTLRKHPLTYIRGRTPGTIESTLEVWVSEVRWREVETFFDCGPRDRVYVVRINDDSSTTVHFGDGKNGARLPTGQDNIVATYRVGSGPDGALKAGQLSLLLDRPLGVRDVINPRGPEGWAPRQDMHDARENAPRTVLTLNRIVSLQDYEDFARNAVGIAKAAAVWTWDGQRRGVLITVASADGEELSAKDLVYSDLIAAIANAGSPHVPFVVKSYRPDTFRLSATLRFDPDRDPEVVLAAVRQVISDRFSFRRRSFGQTVSLSEVYAAIHDVDGVRSADINHLYRGNDARLDAFIPVTAPANGTGPDAPGAELLSLDPASLDDLEVMA